jgi:hypothetical protein
MKPFIISLALCLLFNATAHSVETNRFAFDTLNSVISAPRSNIVVVFTSHEQGAAHFAADQPITFGFLAMTNTDNKVFMLSPEYGYRISATDENGQSVETTSTGRGYGRLFEDIKGVHDKSALDMTWILGYRRAAPYAAYATEVIPSLGRKLPAPQELFKFRKAGGYTVTVELQCLYSTNLYLVRFPPVKLQIIKTEQEGSSDHHILFTTMEFAGILIGILWILAQKRQQRGQTRIVLG